MKRELHLSVEERETPAGTHFVVESFDGEIRRSFETVVRPGETLERVTWGMSSCVIPSVLPGALNL